MKVLHSVCLCVILISVLPDALAANETKPNEVEQKDETIRVAQSDVIKIHSDLLVKFEEQDNLHTRQASECENKFDIQTNLIKQKDDLISNLQTQQQNMAINLNATIKEQNIQIEELQRQIHLMAASIQQYRDQRQILGELIRQNHERIFDLLTQQENLLTSPNETEGNLVDSCIPYANSLGIHDIKLPGMAPFEVLCAKEDWMVIQQRINGKENFNREWTAYRNGFGSLDGDFFLGLEKIYRLTSHKRHELYIHLERFDGKTYYVMYDDFAIYGEDKQYELQRLEEYSSNTGMPDLFKFYKGHKFYTFDRDNEHGCAKDMLGGWWYHNCANSNLNGKYFDHEVEDKSSIYYFHWYSLQKVKMLIRPRQIE